MSASLNEDVHVRELVWRKQLRPFKHHPKRLYTAILPQIASFDLQIYPPYRRWYDYPSMLGTFCRQMPRPQTTLKVNIELQVRKWSAVSTTWRLGYADKRLSRIISDS